MTLQDLAPQRAGVCLAPVRRAGQVPGSLHGAVHGRTWLAWAWGQAQPPRHRAPGRARVPRCRAGSPCWRRRSHTPCCAAGRATIGSGLHSGVDAGMRAVRQHLGGFCMQGLRWAGELRIRATDRLALYVTQGAAKGTHVSSRERPGLFGGGQRNCSAAQFVHKELHRTACFIYTFSASHHPVV